MHIWGGEKDIKEENLVEDKLDKGEILKKEAYKLPNMLIFHAHELFQMGGYATCKYWQSYPLIENNFVYKDFLTDNGTFFKKVLTNKNIFQLYNLRNGESHREYAMNLFFMTRCLMNDFYNNAARDDSYSQWYRFVYKGKFAERIPRYKFKKSKFVNYLNFYISNRFSKYKDFPSFILHQLVDFIFILRVLLNI
jgi:hypothetical protein